MTRICHNHTHQTNLCHREEKTENNNWQYTLSLHLSDFDKIIKVLHDERKIIHVGYSKQVLVLKKNTWKIFDFLFWFHWKFMRWKSKWVCTGNTTITHCRLSHSTIVKLLGVDFDFILSFDNHISNLCKYPARQLNQELSLQIKLICLFSSHEREVFKWAIGISRPSSVVRRPS